MPTYSYSCPNCKTTVERVVRIADRDTQRHLCGAKLFRNLSAPLFRFAGVATKGGGPDKFTADMLGIPLKELPEGLKTPEQPK